MEVGCRHPQDEAATEQLSHLAQEEKGPKSTWRHKSPVITPIHS